MRFVVRLIVAGFLWISGWAGGYGGSCLIFWFGWLGFAVLVVCVLCHFGVLPMVLWVWW